MRVIFSRKGFDSVAGGCASPIIDGRPVPLPIPTSMPTPITYESLGEIADLVEDLTMGAVPRTKACHLDPDIDAALLPRLPAWRGALGQVGAAAGHLRRMSVQPGDVFLFWGGFRPAERKDRWRFVGPTEHRIFGWLQVGEVIELGPDGSHAVSQYPWLSDHPHARPGWKNVNRLYLSSEVLTIGGEEFPRPGWGTFAEGWRLTAPNARPRVWQVPDWLHPERGGIGMSYHPPPRWNADGTVSAAAPGQEFVAEIDGRDDAVKWLRQFFAEVR